MSMISGTQGYKESLTQFIESAQALDFFATYTDFVKYLPTAPSPILDIGSGAGQHAAAMAERGYNVTAIEPLTEFLNIARKTYQHLPIHWLHGWLPALEPLPETATFDFILMTAVWHHLSPVEQFTAIERIATLLNTGGHCALTLRNDPPGVGTCVYATDANITVAQADQNKLSCVLHLSHQASILPGKKKVIWDKLVLQKE